MPMDVRVESAVEDLFRYFMLGEEENMRTCPSHKLVYMKEVMSGVAVTRPKNMIRMLGMTSVYDVYGGDKRVSLDPCFIRQNRGQMDFPVWVLWPLTVERIR